MIQKSDKQLIKYGFHFGKKSVHTSRTIMFNEIQDLLSHVSASAERSEYQYAIVETNCLQKRSMSNRIRTWDHLAELYSLDHNVPIFRGLRYFWDRDVASRRLLAVLAAYSRDTIFRDSTSYILSKKVGEIVTVDTTEEILESIYPDRFRATTSHSIAQNINSSWTQGEYLKGNAIKVRNATIPGIGAVAYALFLGYLTGERGAMVFQTEFTHLLECSPETAMLYSDNAASNGWITQKRIGDIVEITFPKIMIR